MPDAVFIFNLPDLDELQDRLVGRELWKSLRNGLKAKEEIAMMREYDAQL